jgi:sporulation protein YlmC with PRC-barrel domain
MRLTDDSLRGRVVVSNDGFAIGEISKLFVENDWHVHAFEVKLRRDAAERIGIQRSLFHGATIEVPTKLVQSIGDAVLLSVPAESLRHPGPAQTDDVNTAPRVPSSST